MLRDLCGREIRAGQAIITQDLRNTPLTVVEVGEPIIQNTPAGAMPVARVRLILDFTMNVMGPSGVTAPVYIIAQPEELPKPDTGQVKIQ